MSTTTISHGWLAATGYKEAGLQVDFVTWHNVSGHLHPLGHLCQSDQCAVTALMACLLMSIAQKGPLRGFGDKDHQFLLFHGGRLELMTYHGVRQFQL